MHCYIWYMVQCILCIQILKGPKSIWRLESTTCTRFPPHEAYVTQLIGYCTINYNLIICLPFLLTVDHLLSRKKLKFIGKNLIFFIIKDFIPIALQTLKKKRIHEIEDCLKPLYQLEIICIIILIQRMGHCYFNGSLTVSLVELIIISKPRCSELVTFLSCECGTGDCGAVLTEVDYLSVHRYIGER